MGCNFVFTFIILFLEFLCLLPLNSGSLHPSQYISILFIFYPPSAILHSSIFPCFALFFSFLLLLGGERNCSVSTRISLIPLWTYLPNWNFTLRKNKKIFFHCNLVECNFNHKIIAEYISSLTSLINIYCFKQHGIHLLEGNAM